MSTSPANVVAFDDPAVASVEFAEPYPSRSWRYFEYPPKGARAGIWEGEAGVEIADYDYDELCHVLEGRARVTDASGTSREFGPGESFVIARGFKGTWENVTPVRKVFFILD